AGDFGRDEGIAVAIAADPGAKSKEQRQVRELDVDAIFALERGGDFFVEAGQSLEDGDVVVVEAHADFVGDGGLAAADFVGLPQSGDLRSKRLFKRGELFVGSGDAVELLEKLAHAAALHQHRSAGDLSWVRGEDRHDEDAAQPRQGFFRGDASFAHGAQGAPQFAALRLSFLVAGDLQRSAAAFAVIRLGEVDELEVEGEGAAELVGLLDRHGADIEHSNAHQVFGAAGPAFGLKLAAAG